MEDGAEIDLSGGTVGGVRAQCVDAHVVGVDGIRFRVLESRGQAFTEATGVVEVLGGVDGSVKESQRWTMICGGE